MRPEQVVALEPEEGVLFWQLHSLLLSRLLGPRGVTCWMTNCNEHIASEAMGSNTDICAIPSMGNHSNVWYDRNHEQWVRTRERNGIKVQAWSRTYGGIVILRRGLWNQY